MEDQPALSIALDLTNSASTSTSTSLCLIISERTNLLRRGNAVSCVARQASQCLSSYLLRLLGDDPVVFGWSRSCQPDVGSTKARLDLAQNMREAGNVGMAQRVAPYDVAVHLVGLAIDYDRTALAAEESCSRSV